MYCVCVRVTEEAGLVGVHLLCKLVIMVLLHAQGVLCCLDPVVYYMTLYVCVCV